MGTGTSKPKVLFLTKYLCRSATDFLGPVGERYAGLYYTFMQRFGSQYDCYWYSGDERRGFRYDAARDRLEPLGAPGRRTRWGEWLALIRMLLRFSLEWRAERKIVVLSYPYFPKLGLASLMLFVLRFARVRTMVDIQDFPHRSMGRRARLFWTAVDELYHSYAFFIVNALECSRLYRRGRSAIIPMAAHHDIITPGRRPAGPPLNIVYVGTIDERRGFPELVHVIRRIRSEGFAVDLVINGSNPHGIDLGDAPWITLHELQPLEGFAELLRNMDIGVIPYVDREYWDRMSITKMATYMAAGLPILSFPLTETSKILDRWQCGITVEDWQEMSDAIKRLCSDSQLRQTLARNSRKAALEEYNWKKQADRLAALAGKTAKSAMLFLLLQ